MSDSPAYSRPPGAVLFLLASVLFAAAYTQAPLYYSNQNQYFLHGLAPAGEGLLREDWLANTDDPTPVFSALVTVTARFIHPWAFHVYYTLLLGAYVVALTMLFVAVVGEQTARQRWPLFLAFLVAVHAGLTRWASYHWLGLDYPWYLQGGLAGQYLLGAMFQPSSFGVLLLVAICLFVRNRPVLAAACVALGATVHTTYLLAGALLTLGFMTALAAERRFGLALGVGGLTLVLVAPVTLHVLLTFSPTSAATFAAANDILVNFRIPHHCRVDLWLDPIAAAQLAWMLLAILLVWRTRLFAVLGVAFVLMVLLTLVQVVTDSDMLALLFPWRISAILMPAATAVILARLVSSAPRLLETPAARIASVVLILGFVAGGICISALGLGYRTSDEELPVMDFVRRSKSSGDVYLLPVRVPDLAKVTRGSFSSDFKPLPERRADERMIPIDLQRFRLYTGTPIFVDFKSIPYKDTDVLEWRRRIDVAQDIQQRLQKGDLGQALRQLRDAGVTHVVVPARVTVTSRELTKVSPDDEHYAVYRVSGVR